MSIVRLANSRLGDQGIETEFISGGVTGVA
jgi:hypothetical protein